MAVLFRNTLAQSSSFLVSSILSFALTPLLLSRLGLTQFGVWAVTCAIVNYAQVVDLGITSSLSRFVALYDGRGERRGIAECLGLGLGTVACVAAVSAVATMLAAPLLADALGVLDVADMRIVLACAWTIFVVQLARGVLNAVPVGMRRMVGPAIADNVGAAVNFVASVVALALSSELVVYALANAAAAGIALVATFVAFWRVWPPSAISLPNRQRGREILGFGLKSQAFWAAEQVNNQTDKVIIALLVSVPAAAAFEIAARAVRTVKAIGVLTVSALIPTATAEIVRHGRAVVVDYYRHYTARSVAIAFPICVVACVTSPYLFEAWLGNVPTDTLAILVVLTAANFVNVAAGVAMTLTMASGRPGLVASNAVITATLNLAVTAALAPIFGLWGVLAGTFGAITGGTILFMARFHRAFELRRTLFVDAVRTPAALSLGIAAPIVAAELAISPDTNGRGSALLATAVVCALYALPYWLAASRAGLLPRQLACGAVVHRLPPPARRTPRLAPDTPLAEPTTDGGSG